MKGRPSIRLRYGAVLLIAAGLVGSVCVANADAASSARLVQVSVKTAKVGELVQVTGSGWSPVGQTVQIELCGQDALNVSDDCYQADQYTAAIRAGGIFYGAVLTHLPPAPCPCVVWVANQGAFSGVSVPITIVGAPTVPIPSQTAPSTPVVLSANVDAPLSAGALFGAPKSVVLLLRIKNRSTSTYGSPALSVNVGRGAHPGDFVVAKPLEPLGPGAIQVLRIPVTLPAFTFGQYSVRAQVITGEEQVSTVARTSSYPWALFLIAALVLQVVLLFLRNRARTRLGRVSEAELPVEEPKLRIPAEPVEVIDLRLPAEEPVEPVEVVEALEVVDLRTPALSPSDVWTVSHRLALPFPEQGLSCKVEVLACPAVRLQRTTVLAWSDFALSPWDALHDGSVWAERAPDAPLNPFTEGDTFSYDGRGLRLELTVTPVGEELTVGDNRNVVPVSVQGLVSFADRVSHVDVETTLEQGWIPEPPDGVFMADSEPLLGSLAYGRTAEGDSFYLRSAPDGEPAGWLVRDGRASAVVRADRRVEERTGPYPRRLTVEMTDDLGTRAVATGTASNGMAFREGEGLVLECRTEWDLDGVPASGADRSEVDRDTWRVATHAGLYAAANGSAQGEVLVGQLPPWAPVETLGPLWQRQSVHDKASE